MKQTIFYNIDFPDNYWCYEFTKNLWSRKKYVVAELWTFKPKREDFVNGYDRFSWWMILRWHRALHRFIKNHMKDYKYIDYEWYETGSWKIRVELKFIKQ
jgi:hypothetical protein